ncbi:MAG: SAM-dependent chlorinase/fluorinase [Acidimicrobiia bacterium]|nr:SAM-dependent chlorinase/fluorinase [Acidimicrobiia bacterium]
MSLPISFLSDFGTDDEFVGVVHGVMARIAPESRVIDVNHRIPAGNVRAGALSLLRAVQYLPPGVVLAVVDPGVGTDRRALAVETGEIVFVGPDNGLLSPAVAMVGGARRMVALENADYRLPSVGQTFWGRDVFAPAAAALAAGEADLSELGPPVGPEEVTPLLLPLPESSAGRVSGEAWWVDTFGNVQTNIAPHDLQAADLEDCPELSVRIGASAYRIPVARAYAEVGRGELLIHVDSAGLMALAMRDGRACDRLSVSERMSVVMERPPDPTTAPPPPPR